MIDTGYTDGLDAQGIGHFEAAIAPTKSRRIYRVETIQNQLFKEDIDFDELERRFVTMVRAGLDEGGNYCKK